MPFRRQTTSSLLKPAQFDQLRRQLKDEWSNPKTDPFAQPLIIETVEEGLVGSIAGTSVPVIGNAVKLYVVWDAWKDLTQSQRSELIMDVYEELHGLQQSTRVTVAMGLTSIEAQRLGVS